MTDNEKTPALAEERTLEARLRTHADIADVLTQMQAAVGEEAVPAALRLALELVKNGVQETDVVPMLRASHVDGFADVTLQDAVEAAKLRITTQGGPSVLALRLRKIAATLTGPADVETLLYAADRLSAPSTQTVSDV